MTTTHYSIIYLPINLTANERISIGIVLTNSNETLIKFSIHKIKSIKGLLNYSVYEFILNYVKSLEKKNDDLIDFKIYENSIKNEEYLNYLFRYSNNIIQFTKPEEIKLPLNDFILERLFEKFVFEPNIVLKEDIQEKSKTNNYKLSTFYNSIRENVNVDVIINSDKIKNLFSPVEVNFIGKNGIVISGKEFDFNKNKNSLQNEISRFVSLKTAIESNNNESKLYFISEEPSKKHIKAHDLWSDVYKSNIFKYVDFKEVDQIDEYINKHNVRPLFDKEELSI